LRNARKRRSFVLKMEKPMAPDERDRSFDKALARHLRSAAPSGDPANIPADSLLRPATCPAWETLAAYHERSLLPEEMNSWKAHLVGCAHCQAILAQLERTDQIPLQTAATEELLRKKSRRARLLRGARWQWLAPAGAVAAGLLVWIALHENQPLPLPSIRDNKIAANQPAPPPLRAVEPALTAPRASDSRARPQSAVDELASSNARAESDGLKRREKLDRQAESKAVPAMPSTDKEGRLRKDAERGSSDAIRGAENPYDVDAKAVSRAVQEKPELQAQAQAQTQTQRRAQEQAANVQSQNQNYAYSPKVPGPAPLNQTEATKKMKTAPPPAAPAPVSGKFQDATPMMEAVTISNPRLIAAPGSSVIWRAGRAGSIEFSNDSGRSWSRQTSGVIVDLLTGSAPSDKVCWIVGRAGAVLLTTEGGAHWKVMTSPIGEDLGGVRATDALHATIWNVRDTKSFQTSDGGVTWTRVSNP
jgi:hypothetical protein